MTLPFEKFKCDNCGACCESLLVEAQIYDARREPKLYAISPNIDIEKFRDGERAIVLYDSDRKCCPFLSDPIQENGVRVRTCGIYQTRPVECVMVEPGDAKCQQARAMKGLPMLRDSDGNEPSREVLEESCERYSMELQDIGIEELL